MIIEQAPLFRLFKLQIKASERQAFKQIGQQNLLTSIKQEPGTLAMYTGHVDDAGLENRVLELYRDQASYARHAQSSQFQAFKTVAGKAVVEQSMRPLTPLCLLQQAPAIREIAPTNQFVALTEMTVKAAKLSEMQTRLKGEMHQGLTTDAGLVVAYLGQDQAEPQKLVLFEVYRDALAYQQVCQTVNFKLFQQMSQPLIVQQKITAIKPDVLVNHGPLTFATR
ncbi:antibiotic biosynthesis monooxygenase [Lactiplantibacillus sp. WILCCON 0030]|uniref:Antibiotic biosynthesis monooxygenase n=1 Tax=Lactiplantibacillus brownii TaxID=3069269 RepID=A0ABU1AAN4_9LACO|nr:antibiotic biosynthesis monooxygenase [Lactiplantibacillus brownii]MDQ7937976.1 antibiotic biosynthesis monooxygenase [Lactiplantibacillus brownii]